MNTLFQIPQAKINGKVRQNYELLDYVRLQIDEFSEPSFDLLLKWNVKCEEELGYIELFIILDHDQDTKSELASDNYELNSEDAVFIAVELYNYTSNDIKILKGQFRSLVREYL